MRRISLALLVALSMAGCEPVWAYTHAAEEAAIVYYGPKTGWVVSEWTVENVYRAIVTESIGEGREGMEYVASCFWNRRAHGLDICSVGARRSDFKEFERKQPLAVLEYGHHLAVRVVDGEGVFDLVNGATKFESLDFPTPAWVRDGEYREVFRYRKHVFYKKEDVK